MSRHIWTVVCSRSVIDIDSQNISLFDITEQITLPLDFFNQSRQRMLPIELEVVSLWARNATETPDKGRARLSFLSPTHKLIHQQEFDLDLTQTPRTRSRLRISSLPLEKVGEYNFLMDVFKKTWVESARIPINIQLDHR